jgi:hypothetical protein
MRDVVGRAGDEVVEAQDFIASRQERVAQVRPEEPGAAGDD